MTDRDALTRPGRLRAMGFRLLLVALASSGCGPFPGAPGDSTALRVATDWSDRERETIAQAFAEWGRERPDPVSTLIVWLDREASAADLPDVWLGGPSWLYDKLDAEGRLEPLGEKFEHLRWGLSRRTIIGMVQSERPTASPRTVVGDPRVDPTSLAWSLGRLRADGWANGYAKLIDVFGSAETPGWRAGSARAAVGRGDAERTIARLDEEVANMADAVVFDEGMAIRRGTRRGTAARAFLEFLHEARGGRETPREDRPAELSGGAEDLAADLLGATLVDAQDELRRTIVAIRDAGSPKGAVELLSQRPPWPPASVAKLLRKEGDEAASLLETLTVETVPDARTRLWLSSAWLRPMKPIDGPFLQELAAAEGGALAREPRFRDWLRAEWTQWARQRYRWIARLAASHSPLLESIPSSQP